MQNLTKLFEELVDKTKDNNTNLKQISEFDITIKILEEKVFIEKPTYTFPLVDTLGKQTYSNLNKNK